MTERYDSVCVCVTDVPSFNYSAPQKHNIHRTIMQELMLSWLRNFHVIHCASRNYIWNAGAWCVIDEVGHRGILGEIIVGVVT